MRNEISEGAVIDKGIDLIIELRASLGNAERQRDEYRRLLAEALEHLQEYDDYSTTSHFQLERRIDDMINPREA